MNQPLNLSDLEPIISNLLAAGKCACHFLNPHQTRILMWKKEQDNQTTYCLKIGIQKFTSQEQLDRNGETYWRYYTAPITPEEVSKERISAEPNPVTKFNQRQAEAHERNNEPTINSQSS